MWIDWALAHNIMATHTLIFNKKKRINFIENKHIQLIFSHTVLFCALHLLHSVVSPNEGSESIFNITFGTIQALM